jgi:serine/threonine protein kinase
MLFSLSWWPQFERSCACRKSQAIITKDVVAIDARIFEDRVEAEAGLDKLGQVDNSVEGAKVGFGGRLRKSCRLPSKLRPDEDLSDLALEYPYEALAEATGHFDRGHHLGEGGAGAVYRGVLRGGTEVAVKALNDRGGLEGFEEEVRVLSCFRHPNLVTLLGWGQRAEMKYLVYELLPEGDLSNKLLKCRAGKVAFGWCQRLRVAQGAASGLLHMMAFTPRVFHRDIKAANILLDAECSAKMADFGLASVTQQGRNHLAVEHISGTPGYACPAYLRTGCVTEQSEAYSFGMVLLELLVNERPALITPEGDLTFPLLQALRPQAPGAHGRLMAGVDGSAGPWPRHVAEEFGDVGLACVDFVPERRPGFDSIVRSLQRLGAEM